MISYVINPLITWYKQNTIWFIYIYTHSSHNWQNLAVQCIQNRSCHPTFWRTKKSPRRCWDWAGKWLLQHGWNGLDGFYMFLPWMAKLVAFYCSLLKAQKTEFEHVWTERVALKFYGKSKWGFKMNDGNPKWMVCNEKSFWNGWFGGTPILGNLQMMFAEARNARLLLALGKVKAEGGREVTQLVIVPSCVCYGQVNQQHNKLHELHGLLSWIII